MTATEEDMEAGLKLYDSVSLPNELGVSPYILKIFDEDIKPLFRPQGVSRRAVYQAHFKLTGRMANQQWYEKEIFPALTAAGLIIEEPDPENRRRHLIYPPDPTMVVSSTGQSNYRSEVEGVLQ